MASSNDKQVLKNIFKDINKKKVSIKNLTINTTEVKEDKRKGKALEPTVSSNRSRRNLAEQMGLSVSRLDDLNIGTKLKSGLGKKPKSKLGELSEFQKDIAKSIASTKILTEKNLKPLSKVIKDTYLDVSTETFDKMSDIEKQRVLNEKVLLDDTVNNYEKISNLFDKYEKNDIGIEEFSDKLLPLIEKNEKNSDEIIQLTKDDKKFKKVLNREYKNLGDKYEDVLGRSNKEVKKIINKHSLSLDKFKEALKENGSVVLDAVKNTKEFALDVYTTTGPIGQMLKLGSETWKGIFGEGSLGKVKDFFKSKFSKKKTEDEVDEPIEPEDFLGDESSPLGDLGGDSSSIRFADTDLKDVIIQSIVEARHKTIDDFRDDLSDSNQELIDTLEDIQQDELSRLDKKNKVETKKKKKDDKIEFIKDKEEKLFRKKLLKNTDVESAGGMGGGFKNIMQTIGKALPSIAGIAGAAFVGMDFFKGYKKYKDPKTGKLDVSGMMAYGLTGGSKGIYTDPETGKRRVDVKGVGAQALKFGGIGAGIGQFFGPQGALIGGAIGAGVGAITGLIGEENMKKMFDAAGKGIKWFATKISDGAKWLADKGKMAFNFIKDKATAVVNWTKELGGSVFGGFKDLLSGDLEGAFDKFGKAAKQIMEVPMKINDWFWGGAYNIIDNLTGGKLKDALGTWDDLKKKLGGVVKGVIDSVIDKIKELAGQVVDGIVDLFTTSEGEGEFNRVKKMVSETLQKKNIFQGEGALGQAFGTYQTSDEIAIYRELAAQIRDLEKYGDIKESDVEKLMTKLDERFIDLVKGLEDLRGVSLRSQYSEIKMINPDSSLDFALRGR